METQGSLVASRQPATCPYSEPDQYSPFPQPTVLWSILILSSHQRVGLQSGLRPSGPPPPNTHQNPVCTFSPYVLHALFMSFFLIWSLQYLVRNTDHEAARYAVPCTTRSLFLVSCASGKKPTQSRYLDAEFRYLVTASVVRRAVALCWRKLPVKFKPMWTQTELRWAWDGSKLVLVGAVLWYRITKITTS
jgi:hypothetical protein